jgi:epsilon-lactone hydrolase
MHLHGGAYYCGTSRMGRCYSRMVADGGPALAVFFPWADLTQSSDSYTGTAGRDMMTKSGGDWAASLYAADKDPSTPGISPLFGSFTDFPPTLITVGTADALLDEARAVAAKLTAAGVDVALREAPGGIHGFTTMPSPEARAAINDASAFVRDQLRRGGSPRVPSRPDRR